jgi:hypothetical protein
VASKRGKKPPNRRLPASKPSAAPEVGLTYDGWSELFWSWLQGSQGIHMRHQIRRFRTALSELVDHPDDTALRVELIISMDLADTVNRLETRDDIYVTDRGEHGRVAGRTLELEDRIAVILDACTLFRNDLATSGRLAFNSVGAKYLKHILLHEAQHALVRQRGTHTYGEPPADSGVAAEFFHKTAELLLDEYRAEAGARTSGSTVTVQAHNVIEGVDVLARSLRAAHSTYMSDGDLRNLRNQVCMFSQPFWVNTLGYFAAGQSADAPHPAELVDHPLWQEYIGGTWQPIEAALRRAPRSDARAADLPAELLPSLVDELAELLDCSLRQFGFALEDRPEGNYLGILHPLRS